MAIPRGRQRDADAPTSAEAEVLLKLPLFKWPHQASSAPRLFKVAHVWLKWPYRVQRDADAPTSAEAQANQKANRLAAGRP